MSMRCRSIAIVFAAITLCVVLDRRVAGQTDSPSGPSSPAHATPQTQPESPTSADSTWTGRLDVNDVSWLFPSPTTVADANDLISIADLKSSDQQPLLPAADFQRMIDVAQSGASKIGDRQIKLNPAIVDISTWKIAAIRIDPCAPGCSQEISDKFGRVPQIRLILQPVTTQGNVKVHDAALHLIYSYVTGQETASPGIIGKATPDDSAVKDIVADLVQLKRLCKDGGVSTDGPLGVHPGLSSPDKVPTLRTELRAFLTRHLHPARLNAAAIMGLDHGGPEPWIFVALLRNPAVTGQFGPLPSPGLGPLTGAPTAHMITFKDMEHILPAPSTTNRSVITNDLRAPTQERRGVSTAVLFTDEPLDSAATIGVDKNGNAVKDTELKNTDIPAWIANPSKCFFFNTDCASCHTESTRRALRNIGRSTFAYSTPSGVSGLDPDVSPKDQWNLRNFGWFGKQATATQRTANETADVVEFINDKILSQ
jgi:hypothetical protein